MEVLKHSGFSEPNWFNLGLALGLHKPTLDIIETNHRPSRYLTECLTKWLYRVDNVGPPTWDTLADGLYKINDNVVAKKLTKIG